MNAAEELTRSELAYRYARHEDLPFIYSGMLESYASTSPFTLHIPKPLYFQHHRERLNAVLKRKNVQVMLACLSDDPMVLTGFILSEPGILHYCYVKSTFTRMGVATALMVAAGLDINKPLFCSHLTYIGIAIKRKYPALTYDPYLFY